MRQIAIPGILGGMGPAATALLYQRIIHETPAASDQEHLTIVMYARPSIPDRTAAILHGGASPVPDILAALRELDRTSADFILIPCNTAFYFYDEFRDGTKKPIVHLPGTVAAGIRAALPEGTGPIGILATEGTVHSGVYTSALQQLDIAAVYPNPADQALVSRAIYAVKAGTPNAGSLAAVFARLADAGCAGFVLGCTELSVLRADLTGVPQLPIFDSIDMLARAAVERSLARMNPAP